MSLSYEGDADKRGARGSMASLDSIDRRLLAELQAEGRVTNVELAQRVGLTAPPCLRRVRALEEAGVIKGYHAELDASKLGFAITVFAMVSLKSQAEEDLRGFEQHIKGLPEVIKELLMFPHGKTDDIVDSIMQALAFEKWGYDSTLSWV